MAEGPDGKNIIIVKKVTANYSRGAGSVWKVAYADFVTAMMAMFMVLWLVNTASVITRERIAKFFRQPGVFEKGSGTPLEIGGAGILSDAFSPPTAGSSDVTTMEQAYKEKIELEKIAAGIKAEIGQDISSGQTPIGPEQLANVEQISKYLGNVEIKVDQRGLHLEIMDTATASMFEAGSSKINSRAEKEILKIARALITLPNPVDIEGHTDGTPFNSKIRDHYDNWNLSSDRANEARRLLIKAGIQEKQVARVVGYADRRPKTENPLEPTNRRISISMRYTEQREKDKIFGNQNPFFPK